MLRTKVMFFTLLIYAFSFAQNSNKAGVKFVIGNAELLKNQQISWEKIGLNTKIYEGDRIKTSANSRVELEMPDGTVLKINENAVKLYKDENFIIKNEIVSFRNESNSFYKNSLNKEYKIINPDFYSFHILYKNFHKQSQQPGHPTLVHTCIRYFFLCRECVSFVHQIL